MEVRTMARKWERSSSSSLPEGGLTAYLVADAGDAQREILVSGIAEDVEEVARLVENGAKAAADFETHLAGRRLGYFISYAYRHPDGGLPAFGCSSVGVDYPGIERFDQVTNIAAQISQTVKANAVVLSWQRCEPPLMVAPIAGPRLVS
jgi:hypothetical protein